jgi:hypothetical protein
LSESSKHIELVGRILVYIRTKYGANLAIFHDLPGRIGCDKPPKIGAFRPDVYAADAPPRIMVVGEAKVQQDLETEHSKSQIRAFLEFLRTQSSAEFVLAVPWQVKVRARNILKTVAGEVEATQVNLVVIDDVINSYDD